MSFFAVCIHDEPVYVILRGMHTLRTSVYHISPYAYITSPCIAFLSLVYMQNLHPGANLLPDAKLHPGVNLHPLM